jgi:hypothetical protein
VQLDRTHIVIRARTLSEIGDLAMILIRSYPAASILGFIAGMLPWMLMNLLLIGWIPITQFSLGIYDDEMDTELSRYLLLMITLVVLQAPIAGVLTTTLIGRAVFEDGVTWRSAFVDLRKMFWRLFWVLGVVRGPIPLMILIASNWGQEVAPWREVILPLAFLFIVGVQRGRRPFLPEILLLERCPLRAKMAGVITVSRRAAALHGPLAGELIGRFITVSMMLTVLSLAAFQTMLSFRGVLLGQWDWGPIVYTVFIPISLWFAAALSTLIRFLSYLDTRIRLEGWEVDLAVRAETQRQFGDTTVIAGQQPKSPSNVRSHSTVACLIAVLSAGLIAITSTAAIAQENKQAADAGEKAAVTLEMPPATPWYDPEQESLVPIEVKTYLPESANRESRWLPKPKKVPTPKSASTSTSTGTTGGGVSAMNVFGWLVLIVIGFALIFFVLYVFSKVEPDAIASSKKTSRDAMVDVDEQMLERMKQLPAEVRHTDVNLRSEAERLMNLSRFDEAIVMLFGHQLLLLDRCRVLRLARGKTNGRYVRETRGNAPEANSFFVNTVSAFEASYFGGHTPSADRFAKLWQDNTNLESVVRPLWEATVT